MVSFVIGTFGSILSLLGWFGFHSATILFVGTFLQAVETAMEWKALNGNAKKMDVLVFAMGCIIGLFVFTLPWYVGGLIAIAIYNLVMGIFGGIRMLILFLSFLSGK